MQNLLTQTYVCVVPPVDIHHRDSWMSFPLWRHQMETFSALLAICAGNSPVTGEFPHKGQWREALVFSLICAWLNGWIDSREVRGLRSHRANHDVIVLSEQFTVWIDVFISITSAKLQYLRYVSRFAVLHRVICLDHLPGLPEPGLF